MVALRGRVTNAGHGRAAGHGRGPVGFGEEGMEVYCDVAGDREPSDSKSMIRIRRYPFAGNLSKETLKFLVINPPSKT
jgi:hypothetical protein